MIRITGGKHRSRKLVTPESTLTKPTMDKVRAGVFNALGNHLDGKRVLDLFCGSGSYGFEALSRGASHVTFVDNQKLAISIIKKNSEILKEFNIDIIFGDVINFLENSKDKFDIVFIDPPYKLELYQNILDLLENNGLLRPFSIVVMESDKPLNLTESDNKTIKNYKYGLARISVVRYKK